MPTYEYECKICGHAFEELQSMTAPKLVTCPSCKEDSLMRLIGSGSGMIFKGSGFYETDYKKKEAPKSEAKSSAGSCSCCPMKDTSGCSAG